MKQFFLNNVVVEVIKDSPCGIISSKINAKGREDKDDAFFVADLGDIVRKYRIWNNQLPRVEPHYAVKCNDDVAVVSTLAQLGAGFDCASKAEIQKVLDLKVDPSRIVYANPCKQNSHIKFAAKHHVAQMTFDNEHELHKIKSTYPEAKCIVRVLPPESDKVQCQLGIKYGAPLKQVPHLLKVAKELGLSVVGVSFHVGSGCYDATAFSAACASARAAFDMGEKVGYHFDLLDIGGGFPGQKSAKISFEEICSVLRPALDMYFPESSGVRIIAEPGRYFVASAFTLATNIIAKRTVPRDMVNVGDDKDCEVTPDDEPSFMYYINDGVYGSFNCLLYDHAEVEPLLVDEFEYADEPRFTSSIWGPTCDGLDCIKENYPMPDMDTGEWIVFRDMGAYTGCAASNFNGMPKPRCYYYINDIHSLHANHHNKSGNKDIIPIMKAGQDKPINNLNVENHEMPDLAVIEI